MKRLKAELDTTKENFHKELKEKEMAEKSLNSKVHYCFHCNDKIIQLFGHQGLTFNLVYTCLYIVLLRVLGFVYFFQPKFFF